MCVCVSVCVCERERERERANNCKGRENHKFMLGIETAVSGMALWGWNKNCRNSRGLVTKCTNFSFYIL